MKRPFLSPNLLKFILAAVVLMLLADHFIFGGKQDVVKQVVSHEDNLAVVAQEKPKPPPTRVVPENGKEYFEALPTLMEEPDISKVPDTRVPIISKRIKTAKVAIIIDDLGMDVKRSREAIDLPASVTLAFLPYAEKTRELALLAKEKGHELIIHTPMEAMDGHLNIGMGGLKEGMSVESFRAAFDVMTKSFDGYVGINNHMGSRLTQDKDAMARLMEILAEKNLFFVDSKTIESSVAADEAEKAGIPFAVRDVFLDHEESADFVSGALQKVERIALKRGTAIAIGHPKDFTIAGLRTWIPTLKDKGIESVPVSALLVRDDE